MSEQTVMSARQVQAASAEIFERMATVLNQIQDARTMVGQGWELTPLDVQEALEDALVCQFVPSGGVLLVWWDAEGGLRLNPAAYPATYPIEQWQDDGQGWGG
jgi:hypothetical protein